MSEANSDADSDAVCAATRAQQIKDISKLHPGDRFRLMFGHPLLPEPERILQPLAADPNHSASVDAILAADTGDSSLIHNLAKRALEMEALATALMTTCYSEANRLANHGTNNGCDRWAMENLYAAANAAKEKLKTDSATTGR